MNREQCIEAIRENRIIVIVRGVERKDLIPFAEAVYEGGVRLLEITYDACGKTPDEETADRIRELAEHFRGRMYIGAGTVLTEKQVELTKNAGGLFIISPDCNPDVIRKTRAEGLVSLPGAFTPTEIALAHRFGADFVKVFPAGELGAGYIKAVKAPLSNVELLAVGGVKAADFESYLAAGASGFGIGSDIVDKKQIAAGNFAAVTEHAREYSEKIREICGKE